MKFKSNIELQSGLKDSSGAVGTSGQLLSSTGTGVSWASLNGFVPYTGATQNVDLGIYTLLAAKGVFSSSGGANTVEIGHSSGSGIALNITKGGNGEGLYINKTSGSGNAASITGGVTLLSELNLTTDLADAYIASAATWNGKQNALSGTGIVKSVSGTISYLTDNSTNWNTAFNKKINSAAVTGTTTKTLTLTQQDGGTITADWTDIGNNLTFTSPLVNTAGVISIPAASGSVNGFLSSTDWATFNAKQNALSGTGFVKISGTEISYDNSTYALNSVVVKLTGDQTVAGIKTFTATPNFDNNIYLKKTGSWANPANYSVIGGMTYGFFLSSAANKHAYLDLFQITQARQFDFPDKSGTFAMTSDVPTISGTTNYIPKFTGSSTLGNSLIYDNGTNVGIGTTTPAEKLTVNGGPLRIESATGVSSYVHYISPGNDEWSAGMNGAYDFQIAYSNGLGTPRMTLLKGGNVGIGTISPGDKLAIGNGSESINVRITGNNSGSASGSAVNVGISGVTNIAIGNKSAILGGSYNSTALVYWGNGGNLSFNNGSDRMTITNGGNVLVGPATDLGYKFTVSNGTQSFNVVPAGAGVDLYSTGNFAPHYQSDFSWYTGVPGAGTFRMGLSASGNLTISGTATATGFFNSSDIRLKNIISQDGDVIRYKWKDGRDDRIHIGVIAQEVQKLYPDMVQEGTDEEKTLSVNYIELLVLKNRQLEKRIESLEKLILNFK